MNTFRAAAAAILAVVSCVSPVSAFTPADYVGDWEILILGTESSFSSGALRLEMGDGHLRGQIVWRYGGVKHVPDDGSIFVDKDGYLVVKQSRVQLRVLRLGDHIEGTGESKGDTFRLYGRRFQENIDLAGTWTLEVGSEASAMQNWHLRLTLVGGGSYAAQLLEPSGHPSPVREFVVTGRKGELLFGKDGSASLEFQGDRLVGSLSLSEKHPVRGHRLRRWGAPQDLIAGETLAGWKPRDYRVKYGWSCKDGVLTNSGDGDVDIVSEAEFRDFKLHLEYNVVRGGNSGVYVRGQYEIQIVDDHGKEATKSGAGAIYGRFVPTVNASRPPETWQTLEVTLIGQWITVVLNGETVVDNGYLEGVTGGARTPFKAESGPLMLQGDHGKIQFRNVVVTPALTEE